MKIHILLENENSYLWFPGDSRILSEMKRTLKWTRTRSAIKSPC